jgi:shikimate dehydrogenase
VQLQGKSVVVVGAGATARACIEAFSHTEVSRIGVMNRSKDRAQQALHLAAGKGYVAQLSDVPEVDVIIHTTPIGMKQGVPGGKSPLPKDMLRSHHVVLDAVYQPLETQLLLDARNSGAQAIDGLWMLVYQAKAQQLLWTGSNPDPLLMRFAAERELAQRGR